MRCWADRRIRRVQVGGTCVARMRLEVQQNLSTALPGVGCRIGNGLPGHYIGHALIRLVPIHASPNRSQSVV